MPSKKTFLKFLGALTLGAGLAVILFSLMYNRPIRFRPKWNTSPNSTHPLHPTHRKPDNIVLTPTDDPTTRVAITWRASADVTTGVVQYVSMSDPDLDNYQAAVAERHELLADELITDKTASCFSVTLAGLSPILAIVINPAA